MFQGIAVLGAGSVVSEWGWGVEDRWKEVDLSSWPLLWSAEGLWTDVLLGSGAEEKGKGQLSEGMCHTERLASVPQEIVFVQRQTGGFHFSNLQKN